MTKDFCHATTNRRAATWSRSILKAALPELKDGLHALLSGAPIHIVRVAVGENVSLRIILSQDLPGMVLEGCAQGIQASNERALEILQAQQQNGQKNRIILPGQTN